MRTATAERSTSFRESGLRRSGSNGNLGGGGGGRRPSAVRLGGSTNSLGGGTSSSARAMLAAARRRSSASEATISAASIEASRTSLFCPMPKPKRGFFYSRAYKEHKKKRKEKRRNQMEELAGGDGRDGGAGGGSSVDDEIPLKRDLTRRKRNSFMKDGQRVGGGGGDGDSSLASGSLLEPTNVTAYLAARVESERPEVSPRDGAYDHGAALLASSTKSHMMDIELVGKDDERVRAARFVLACYSPVLEEVFFKGRECPFYDGAGPALAVPFCNGGVLRAAVHHCFKGELPDDFSVVDASEPQARNLAQLDHLAHVYKFSSLGEVTYRALRKLINGRVVLACAIFDELSHREGAGAVDSIKRYALDSMREMPMDSLLGGGVQWMKEESVEAIMQDQDMDVDEFYMFKILSAWASFDAGARRPVARRLSRHIELKFIEPELLVSQVRDSGYFDERDITEAVTLIKNSLATRDPSEMERVLVEGAGSDIVNGVYCRVEEEVGVSEEEFLFVKEAEDGYSDVGLYMWNAKWYIAMCADYSNCFYSCDDPPDKGAAELVPGGGWAVAYNGQMPAPYCTYLPITRMGRSSATSDRGLVAPNLEEMMDPTIAEKRRSGYFDKRTDDVIEKRTMTLEQMMHLPEDRAGAGEVWCS